MRIVTHSICALALAAALPAAAGEPRDFSLYFMGEAEELALAASAGPATVTADATYHVLGRDGYRQARAGTNGWHCFVQRAWFLAADTADGRYDPRVRAPHCINAAGAESRMRHIFLEAGFALAGHDRETVERLIDEAYDDGRLALPDELALTYMQSRRQWLGPRIGPWLPHMMLWIPYLTAADTGDNPLTSGQATLGGEPGSRDTVLIIPTAAGID